MANIQVTTDYVANKLVTPFTASLGALRHANTDYTSIFEKQSGQGVPLGTTVQMRRQPTYPANSTSTTVNGAMSLNLASFQQQTLDLTVDEFIYTPIELNVIEHALRVGTAEDVLNDQYIKPARMRLQSQVKKKIYNAFLTSAYYQVGDGSAALNDTLPVSQMRAGMTSLNMDKMRYLGLSPFDESSLSSTFVGLFNNRFNTEALEMGLLSQKFQGFETYEDENIEEFEAGTASAATLGTVTLGAAVINNAQALSLANASGGSITWRAGDALEYMSPTPPHPILSNYFFVSQVDRRKIPPSKISLKSIVVAPSAAEVTAVTFPAWDVPSQTYIAADATTIVVKISRTIQTDLATNNFAYINADYTGDGSVAGQIPSGTVMNTFGNRNVNMGFVKNALYIASPAPEIVKNSEFTVKRENGLSVVVAQQGVLFPNFSNYSLVGLMIGVRFSEQGIMALNTSST